MRIAKKIPNSGGFLSHKHKVVDFGKYDHKNWQVTIVYKRRRLFPEGDAGQVKPDSALSALYRRKNL